MLRRGLEHSGPWSQRTGVGYAEDAQRRCCWNRVRRVTAGMGGEAAPTASPGRSAEETDFFPHPESDTFSDCLGIKLTTRTMRENFLSCFSSSLQCEMTDGAISIKVSPTPCLSLMGQVQAFSPTNLSARGLPMEEASLH